MKQGNKLIVYAIAVMVMTSAVVLVQPVHQAEATTKLIDTSTGEGTEAGTLAGVTLPRRAPVSISDNNVYIAWWTNDTANNNNEDVMFRASMDGGQLFGDKINLSNTTDSDSTRVEIDSDVESVVVTWWETNQTDDTPVMRVSNDNGATFGPVLTLATNGTIGGEGG